MSEGPFQNTEEFVQIFRFGLDSPYQNLTYLVDRKAGFSITRNYPDDLLFKPAKTKAGNPDSVALIHTVYVHPNESGKAFIPERVPIVLSISTHSLFLGKGHRDYHYDAPDCPASESVEASKKSTRPLSLNSWDEFHFSHDTDMFHDENEQPYAGVELLDTLFEKHCNTARRLKGLPIRTKLRSQAVLGKTFGWLVDLLTKSLRVLFARTLKKSPGSLVELTGYPGDALVLLSDDTLNLFGYKASKNVVVTFSALVTIVALAYAFFGTAESLFLKRLFSNPLFPVGLGIFLLWLMDSVIPELLFLLLNACIKLRMKVWFWRLRI